MNPNQTAQQIKVGTANQSAAMIENLNNSKQVVTESRVFRSTLPSCVYVFKAGKHANFIDGKYRTNIAHEIAELDAEIAAGHTFISSKPEELVSAVDPMTALREKFRAELLAEQAAAAKTNPNIGSTDQGKLNVASSEAVKQLSAGSSSPAGAPAPAVAK